MVTACTYIKGTGGVIGGHRHRRFTSGRTAGTGNARAVTTPARSRPHLWRGNTHKIQTTRRPLFVVIVTVDAFPKRRQSTADSTTRLSPYIIHYIYKPRQTSAAACYQLSGKKVPREIPAVTLPLSAAIFHQYFAATSSTSTPTPKQ